MKRTTKRFLGILLSFVLMLTMMPALSQTAHADTHNHEGWTAWNDSGDLPNSAGSYYLDTDVTLGSDWNLSGEINLCLNGHTIDLNNNHKIRITSGNQLNIYDCKGTGKITGYNDSSSSGFAVHIQSGNFRMYGGSFTGNTACYVVYVDGGAFTMSGGSFTNNAATWDCVRSRGTFTMSGGSFTNNSGTSVVTVYQGSTTMSGGSITGNTLGRGAVNVYSTFTMSGGSITDNTVGGSYGGVIVQYGKTFNVSGNVTITGNKTSGNENRNVLLGKSGDNAAIINVVDNLDNAARIGVTRDISGVFTNGLSSKGTADNFISDRDDVTFSLTDAGELQMSSLTPATVTTAPTAKTLTATGSAQTLVTAGVASGGTMQYALGTNATTAPTSGWSEDIPTGTEAKTYYVWYKAAGDATHSDSEPKAVTVTIKGTDPAKESTITYDLNGGTLDGKTGTVTVKVANGTVITLPEPTRDGYTFDYWEGSKYNAGDKYTVNGDHTFKAVWKTAASGDGSKGGSSSGKNGVKTGDTNDIAGLLALMLASVGALGAMEYRRRKEH